MTMYEGYNISDEDIALLAAHGIRPIAGAHDSPYAHSHNDSGGTDDPTYGPNNKNAGKPGYDINGRPLSDGGLPAGFVIGSNGELIPPGTGPTAGSGIPAGTMFRLGDNVYWWNGKSITQASAADSKAYRGDYDLDPTSATGYAENGTAGNTTGAPGGSGSGTRLASDDPRYWQLQYDQLAAQYMNMGLDAESARRQALATLITNRNNTATDVAGISASVAKTAADYAAHPGDPYAEAYYANQVGGSTPFGDLGNKAFGEYGKTLAEKGERIFQNVAGDLNSARTYRDAIPPVDFFGPETRTQLGLQPTAAQAVTGGGTGASTPVAGATASANPLAAMMERLNSMSPQEQADFRKWTTTAAGQPTAAAKGAQIDFDGMMKGRTQDGFSPASSEGGTNLNIHERAVVVGESGHVYATLGEKRPDGTMRAEQLMIKPLKSETDKDKKLAEAGKQQVESQKKTLASFATGGSVAATPDDLLMEFTKMFQRLGGPGGGSSTPFGGTRFLAGAPANAMLESPMLRRAGEATYDAMGIRPDQLWADIKKFTPNAPINNAPRTTWI